MPNFIIEYVNRRAGQRKWAYAPSCPALRGGLFAAGPLNAGGKNAVKKQRIPVYLGPEEYGQIQESAKKAGSSLAAFTKLVCLGTAVPSLEHRYAIRDILKVNVD
jgi:hypothetical protein